MDKTLLSEESTQAPKAPGMKYRHYAPKAKLIMVEGDLREEILAIRQISYEADRKGKPIGIIATSETLPFYNHGIVKNIGTRRERKNNCSQSLQHTSGIRRGKRGYDLQ